jgi:hypothetical protein
MRAADTSEVRKLMFPTHTTIRARFVSRNLGPFVPPHIKGEERVPKPIVGPD